MLILVAVLSLIPVTGVGTSDKLLHFLTYFILSSAFVTLVKNTSLLKWIMLSLIIYGVLLEVLQGFTGYRMMDVKDMLANSAGVLAGLLLRFTLLPEWLRRIESRWL